MRAAAGLKTAGSDQIPLAYCQSADAGQCLGCCGVHGCLWRIRLRDGARPNHPNNHAGATMGELAVENGPPGRRRCHAREREHPEHHDTARLAALRRIWRFAVSLRLDPRFRGDDACCLGRSGYSSCFAASSWFEPFSKSESRWALTLESGARRKRNVPILSQSGRRSSARKPTQRRDLRA